jgi:hypothetical protein
MVVVALANNVRLGRRSLCLAGCEEKGHEEGHIVDASWFPDEWSMARLMGLVSACVDESQLTL